MQATTTVYTLPSSDPRYPATNVSTSLRHVYGKLKLSFLKILQSHLPIDLPPSYDQVVIQSTVQTPVPTSSNNNPPNFAETDAPPQVVVAK